MNHSASNHIEIQRSKFDNFLFLSSVYVYVKLFLCKLLFNVPYTDTFGFYWIRSFIVCSQFVHCSLTVHSSFVHCSFIVCSPFVHCSFIVCSTFVHCLLNVRSPFFNNPFHSIFFQSNSQKVKVLVYHWV